MENIFNNYGIEIVVGMIISVLSYIFFRVVYFTYKKNNFKIMPLITPLSSIKDKETQELVTFFNETLGFCPNSVLIMQKSHIWLKRL